MTHEELSYILESKFNGISLKEVVVYKPEGCVETCVLLQTDLTNIRLTIEQAGMILQLDPAILKNAARSAAVHGYYITTKKKKKPIFTSFIS